jgi:outer membrane protein OmpA-like peptidoglycan-associated protein
MSWRDLLAPARQAPPHWTPSAAQETEARDAAAGGEALTRVAPGVDFVAMRLHADAEAAELADAFGARAFTYGSDIFMGGGHGAAETGELVAHEAVHVAQQAAQGSPVLQFAPKDNAKAGPGANPPDEDFISDPDNWGAEDDHVLFKQDDIGTLDDDDLKAFAAKQAEAVSVQLHGYASEEGGGKYNLNLSAQRAVAIRHRLMELLPAGSRVVVFAHGESRHFGAADQNRRVGISLIGPEKDDLRLRTRFGPTPRFTHQLPQGPTGVGKVPSPSGVTDEPPPPIPRLDQSPLLGPLPPGPRIPYYLMDNPAILSKSAIHGHLPSETGNIVDLYGSAYLKYHNLGIPDQLQLGPFDLGAGELANKEVKNAIDAYWERNNPTVIEQSNEQVGAHVFSYDVLDLFRDKPKKPKDR